MFEEKNFPLIFFFTKSTFDNGYPQWRTEYPVCMAQTEKGPTLLKSFDVKSIIHVNIFIINYGKEISF